MTTTANRRPVYTRTAVEEASPASTHSVASEPAKRNPAKPIEWYAEGERHIHRNPDWALQWVAKHLSGKQPDEDFKTLYRAFVDKLYDHPDRERGAALAWEVHDAVKGWLVNRAYRRRYPPMRPAAITYHHDDCACGDCEKWRAAVAR